MNVSTAMRGVPPQVRSGSGSVRRRRQPADRRRNPTRATEAVRLRCPPVSSSQLFAFLLSAESLRIGPRPSVLCVVSRGVAYGRLAAVATVAGNTLGCCVQVIAVAAGLGAVVATSTTVFTAMKLIGGAYLVYLGVRAW